MDWQGGTENQSPVVVRLERYNSWSRLLRYRPAQRGFAYTSVGRLGNRYSPGGVVAVILGLVLALACVRIVCTGGIVLVAEQPNYPAVVGPYRCGRGAPLLVIAGPCVIESELLTLRIAEQLASVATSNGIQLVFKASFDKANRTSIEAYRGPGLQRGLEVLARVKRETGLPVTTDIHQPDQAGPVGEVCDLVQIPAFLSRQTDLLVAVAQTGRAVHVKKGQFLAPWDMRHVVGKLVCSGARNILLCERGTFFGYGRLVNDMRSIPQMQQLGVPVVFDATHSVQEPGGLGAATGGNRAMVEPLARAAAALGAEGLFLETHPDPDSSPSDGPNMVPLDAVGDLVSRVVAIRGIAEGFGEQ